MKPIISKRCRIRVPRHFKVGPYSIVDDFSYFSTKVTVGTCSHIASGCSIAGGKEWHFRMGDYSSLSSGVKVWLTSDDFVNDVVTLIPPAVTRYYGEVKKHCMHGDVTLGNYTAVGANSVIMPGVTIPEGTVIGSLSVVPAGKKLKPWSVYAGIPARCIKRRNRVSVITQARLLEYALASRPQKKKKKK